MLEDLRRRTTGEPLFGPPHRPQYAIARSAWRYRIVLGLALAVVLVLVFGLVSVNKQKNVAMRNLELARDALGQVMYIRGVEAIANNDSSGVSSLQTALLNAPTRLRLRQSVIWQLHAVPELMARPVPHKDRLWGPDIAADGRFLTMDGSVPSSSPGHCAESQRGGGERSSTTKAMPLP